VSLVSRSADERGPTVRTLVSTAAVLLGVAALGLALSGPTTAIQAGASCSASPTTVQPGDTVVLDASASGNVSEAAFDVDGDGTYEVNDSTDLVVEHAYAAVGEYEPAVRVVGNGPDRTTETDRCGNVTVAANDPPRAELAADPSTSTVGEPVVLDASGTTDPDGTVVEYRWDPDGDGSVETVGGEPRIDHTYDETGTYGATVTVVDDDGANATAAVEVAVQSAPPAAACTVAPDDVGTGETVTVDASGTTGATAVAVDGDGSVERTLEDSFVTTATYESTGTVTPTVTARNDAGEDTASCGQVEVGSVPGGTNASEPGAGETAAQSGGAGGAADASGESPGSADPGVDDEALGTLPHVAGTVALLGGAGWLLGRARESTGDDPRPRGVFEWRSDLGERFAAGRLDLSAGASVAADHGFVPDLVLLDSVPAAGAVEPGGPGSALDERTASAGVAASTPEGVVQHAVGARWTDDARTASGNGAAVAFPVEEGVARASVVATEDGFALESDDALEATVCYRALRLPGDVDAVLGTASVAAGTDSVTLRGVGDLDALLLDAATSEDADDPVLATGTSARDDQVAFHRREDGADVATGRVLDLDGAGRAVLATTGDHQNDDPANDDATNDGLPTLEYEEAAGTDHRLQFVGIAGAPVLAPATGTLEVGVEEGSVTVDVGFRPAMVEYWVARSGDDGGDPAEPWVAVGAVVDQGGSSETVELRGNEADQPGGPESATGAADAERGPGTDGSTGTDGSPGAGGGTRVGGNTGTDAGDEWHDGPDPRGPGVTVVGLYEDGFRLEVPGDWPRAGATTGEPVNVAPPADRPVRTVVYRAWPGPLSGGLDEGEQA